MIIRTPLCTVRGCPARRDPDWHIPWCWHIRNIEHSQEGSHQHVPKRSQGGKEVVSFLCVYCHDRIDNGAEWSNDIVDFDGKRIYRIRANGINLLTKEIPHASQIP